MTYSEIIEKCARESGITAEVFTKMNLEKLDLNRQISEVNNDILFEDIVMAVEEYVNDIRYVPSFYKRIMYREYSMFLDKVGRCLKVKDIDEKLKSVRKWSGDLSIEILKALHGTIESKREFSYEEIKEKLPPLFKDRITRTTLLSLNRAKGKDSRYEDIYVAGQKIENNVVVSTGKPNNRKGYRIYNSIHPIFLQENVTQLGVMLMGLADQFAKEENAALYVGMDIWTQLSDYGRTRVEEVFCPNSENLRKFIKEINNSIVKFQNVEYASEAELFKRMIYVNEQLRSINKTGRHANVYLEYEDEERVFHDVEIKVEHNVQTKEDLYYFKPMKNSDDRIYVSEDNVYNIELL